MVEPFIFDKHDTLKLHSQYHGCWCPGDTRIQGTSSHGFYRVTPEYSDLGIKWLKVSDFHILEITAFTVYPKKYAHCFCFAVLCCGYTLTDFPYSPGLLRWYCSNLTIAPVPAKQPWRIWINTSCEIIMNDYITTTKQSTTKPWAYLLGYTVYQFQEQWHLYKT